MRATFAVFCGLTALAWLERQPPQEKRGLASWIVEVGHAYRRGMRSLLDIWNGNLFFGLVVFAASLVGLGATIFIGQRVGWASVSKVPYPDVLMHLWWVVTAAVVCTYGLWRALRDGFREIVRLSRFTRGAFTIVAAIIAGGIQGFGYYPALAAQLSPKEAFDSYSRLHSTGEPLALLGVRSRSSAYYANGNVESFTDVTRAFAWLMQSNERRWLLMKSDDLPKLNSLYRTQKDKNLPVLDGRSSQNLLVSNVLKGKRNENSLSKVVLDEPPIQPIRWTQCLRTSWRRLVGRSPTRRANRCQAWPR